MRCLSRASSIFSKRPRMCCQFRWQLQTNMYHLKDNKRQGPRALQKVSEMKHLFSRKVFQSSHVLLQNRLGGVAMLSTILRTILLSPYLPSSEDELLFLKLFKGFHFFFSFLFFPLFFNSTETGVIFCFGKKIHQTQFWAGNWTIR